MAEEKVEAPERIWLPRATLDHGGGSIYIGQAWDDNDTEYVRVDHASNTRQRAERAVAKIVTLLIGHEADHPLGGYPRQSMADIIAAEFEK